MSDAQLRHRVKRLETLLGIYRKTFAPLLSIPNSGIPNRGDVIALVGFWRESLRQNRIYVDDDVFIANAAKDAEDLLRQFPLDVWRRVIVWFWRAKPSHRHWAAVPVVRLSTLAKAQPEWAALEGAKVQNDNQGKAVDFSIYDR